MASNQKNTYPHFYANQVLKSSSLNNSFAFLDGQTRLSRVHFLGCGIVEGLDYSYDEGVLVINQGVAVNKEGWLVEIPNRTRYRFVADVDFSDKDFLVHSDDEPVASLDSLMSQGGSRIKKICFRTEDDVRQFDNRVPEPISNLNMDNYVVALAFGMRREYNSRSPQDSGDVNTADYVLEVWPVLIETGDVKCLFRRINPMNVFVSRRKEPCIKCYHGDVQSFQEQILASVRYWKVEVIDAMDSVIQYLRSIPSTAWRNVLSDKNLVNRFEIARHELAKLVSPRVKKIPDYYVFFFSDLAIALNEFINEYNAFANKYKVIPDYLPSDLLIYLGCLHEDEREGNEVYRSIFRSARNEEMRSDSGMLERMLIRICVLIESFIGEDTDGLLAKQPFRLMKVRTSGRLSERPLPFYYDSSKGDVKDAWYADKPFAGCSLCGMGQDGYLSGAGSMIDDGWSLYPTAYQGKALTLVKSEWETLNEEMRLPMDLVEADLNTVTVLTEKEAALLRETFAPLSESKAETFLKKVEAECSGDAFKLVESLGLSYDGSLIDSLQKGEGLTKMTFREIRKIEKIDESVMSELAQAFYKAKGKKTDKTISELSSALLSFARAWRNSFIVTDKDISMDEIGKAISLAPVRRGCRVFLFTKSGDDGVSGKTVVSYSVVYRNASDVPAEVAKKEQWFFRLRTNGKTDGEFANVPGMLAPYSDDRWLMAGDELSFCPFIDDGSSIKMFETAKSNIAFESSNPDILDMDRIEIREKKYPCVILKMKGNGKTWVTLKIMDTGHQLLHSQQFYVDVDNPEWNKVAVTSVSITPQTTYEVFVGQTVNLAVDVKPKDATDNSVTWTSDDHSVAEVESDGKVTILKEGTAKITATSSSDKDKTSTATIQAYSLVFRLKKSGTDASGIYKSIPATLYPFTKGECYTKNDQIEIKFGKSDGQRINSYEPETSNIIYDVDDKTILKPSVEIQNKLKRLILKMLGKNGMTTVSLKVLNPSSGKEVLHSETFTVVVDNPEWNKILVRSVTVDPQKLDMFVNQKRKFVPIIVPNDADEKDVFWRSSDTSIATVDSSSGEVMAIKAGSVDIFATTKEGSKTNKAEVRVSSIYIQIRTQKLQKNGEFAVDLPDIVRPYGENGLYAISSDEKIRLYLIQYDGLKEKDLEIDQSCLVAEVQDKNVLTLIFEKYSSSSDSVLAHIVMKKNGKSNVTVRIKDPNGTGDIIYQKTFTVEVKNPEWDKVPVTGVNLSSPSSSLFVSETIQMSGSVNPETATKKDIFWSSDDPSILTVDKGNGIVRALKAGSTKVTVTTEDGHFTKSKSIQVYAIQFHALLKNKENGSEYAETTEVISPYTDDRWKVMSGGKFNIYVFKFDGLKTEKFAYSNYELSCGNYDTSILDVYVNASGTPYCQLIFKGKNGNTNITLNVKNKKTGEIIAEKTFTIRVDNPEWRGINTVSITVLQQATVLPGSNTVKIRFEGTAYEIDLSGNKTGKTQTISIEKAFSSNSNWNDYLSAPNHWYFLDKKIRVSLNSRLTAVGSWKTVREGFIDISQKKVTLKLTGHYMKDNLNLGGSASEGYSLFM